MNGHEWNFYNDGEWVNRSSELQQFDAMLAQAGRLQVLLVEDENRHTGKSWLLARICQHCRESLQLPVFYINFAVPGPRQDYLNNHLDVIFAIYRSFSKIKKFSALERQLEEFEYSQEFVNELSTALSQPVYSLNILGNLVQTVFGVPPNTYIQDNALLPDALRNVVAVAVRAKKTRELVSRLPEVLEGYSPEQLPPLLSILDEYTPPHGQMTDGQMTNGQRTDGQTTGDSAPGVTYDIRTLSIQIEGFEEPRRGTAFNKIYDAFFADLFELAKEHHPVVLAFDAYDYAQRTPGLSTFQSWLHSQLLSRAGKEQHNLIIIVSGLTTFPLDSGMKRFRPLSLMTDNDKLDYLKKRDIPNVETIDLATLPSIPGYLAFWVESRLIELGRV